MCMRVLMMPKAGDKMENFTSLFKYSLRLPIAREARPYVAQKPPLCKGRWMREAQTEGL